MSLKKFLKNKEVVLIIVLGFILRFHRIRERFVFDAEQSVALWPIIRLFQQRKLTLVGVHSANYKSGIFRPPFFIYLFALPLKILKFNPLGLGFIFVLISLGSIFLIYLSAKKIFNQKTALLASFLYSINPYIINADKNVWTYTPIIITSALILFLSTKVLEEKNKRKKLFFFVLGSLVGLGFSFHFQAAIILISLILIFLKTKGLKNTLFFILGTFCLLSPLVIFNLRHEFIMVQGFKKLLFTNEVILKQSQTLGERINNGLKTFSDLSLSVLPLPKIVILNNLIVFLVFFIAPTIYLYKKTKLRLQRFTLIYCLLCCFFSLIILVIIDQGGYSSTAFYLWFLIPLILVIWTRSLILLTKKNKLILFLIIFLFSFINLYTINKQGQGGYQQKIRIIDYILKNSAKKQFSLKFINRDVLAYDYLFYYRAPYYQRTFKDINLMEEWHEGEADFYLIHGNYDWNKDKYQLLPAQKTVDFQGVRLVIK